MTTKKKKASGIRRELPADFDLADLVTEGAFAKRLGVSVDVLRALRKRGMPYLRIGGAMNGRVFLDVPETVAWILTNCKGNPGAVTGSKGAA